MKSLFQVSTNRAMNWKRLVSWIPFVIWETLCLHGLSFWTMRRLPNGQLNIILSKHGVIISFILFTLIICCISKSMSSKIDAFTSENYLQIDHITNFAATIVAVIITPVIFLSVWMYHRKLRSVGEKMIRVSEILSEIQGNFDKQIVEKEICKWIAPVVVGYLSLYGVMAYMFNTATGVYERMDGLWECVIYWVAQLSPIYMIFMSIVKITITLCVTATRFNQVKKILKVV